MNALLWFINGMVVAGMLSFIAIPARWEIVQQHLRAAHVPVTYSAGVMPATASPLSPWSAR